MLFDPRPKEKREDIFDREQEIEMIKNSAKEYPITLILGIRRVGKSSLLKVVLNELESGIYIDVRKLHFDSGGWITNESLLKAFENGLNSLSHPIKREVFQYLKRVKGVSIAGLQLSFEPEVSLSEILEALNKRSRVIIAFDEAQYLRFYGRRGGKEFLTLVAYAYDNLPNISFIFTGSEIGLLHDLIGVSDYESPLYGRIYNEITISPFSRELSIEFLRQGFVEAGIKIREEEIEHAAELLGGIPGWLVEFGYNYIKTKSFENAIKGVMRKAEKFLEGELRELEKRSPRYILVLRAISMGFDRWTLIKEFLESRSGKIPNSRLAAILEALQKMSWINAEYKDGEKRYRIIDPVIERVIKECFNL